jgi:hypothetical protein
MSYDTAEYLCVDTPSLGLGFRLMVEGLIKHNPFSMFYYSPHQSVYLAILIAHSLLGVAPNALPTASTR